MAAPLILPPVEPGPRGPGRPSLVDEWEGAVLNLLREHPKTSAAEVIRRARAVGYKGGRTAMYELVRRCRESL